MLKKTGVFIHGAGGSSQVWANQISSIKGHDLIALDLPGHGSSIEPPLTSIENYRQFVWDEIIREPKEPQNIVLIGHSMGGAIAMDLALTYPEFVEGVILISTGAKLRVNPAIFDSLSQGNHPFEIIHALYSPTVSPSQIRQAAEEMENVRTEVYWADFLACDGFNRVETIPSLCVPALILCGDEDRMTPLKYSQYLHKSIADSQLKIIPGAGHMCMLEKPEEISQAITEFLNNLP
ncbi:MAG: alpha/beta fold hydrolase [Desulfitobacterium sp.]